MSFNKRYCYKDSILRSKSYEDVLSMTKADAVFFDGWTSEFFKNFEFNTEKYKDIRTNTLEKNKYNSGVIVVEGADLHKLGNLYIHLKQDPSWLDIQIVLDILNIEVKEEDQGKFEPLCKFCIKEIERHFEKTKSF